MNQYDYPFRTEPPTSPPSPSDEELAYEARYDWMKAQPAMEFLEWAALEYPQRFDLAVERLIEDIHEQPIVRE